MILWNVERFKHESRGEVSSDSIGRMDSRRKTWYNHCNSIASDIVITIVIGDIVGVKC